MLKTRRIILFSAKLIKLSDIFAYTEENYLEGVELADGRMLYSFDFWDDAAYYKPLIAITYCEAGVLIPSYDAEKSTYGRRLCYGFLHMNCMVALLPFRGFTIFHMNCVFLLARISNP